MQRRIDLITGLLDLADRTGCPVGRWPFLHRTVVLGDVVVRLPHRDYRASVPTQTGVFGAGDGGHLAWATSLPRLDASDDVRRPPAGH